VAKFIATGDWHIGARMGTAGEAAPRFREALFHAVERVIELAAEEEAGAIFLLGDTFDGDKVGLADIQRVADLLARAPCEVFVLPGNHDWWHEGGVLAAFARKVEDAERITVLTATEQPLRVEALPGLTFFPCPVLRRSEVVDPTRWIPTRNPEDGLRVGLFHGPLDRADVNGIVPERVAEVRDLDLALLGDWHKPVDGPDGRTFYTGSLEPGGFGEGHTGGVVVATADAASIEARRVEVGRLAWRSLEVEVESADLDGVGPEAVAQQLAGITTAPEHTALRLRLSGKLTMPELDELDRIVAATRELGWATCDVEVSIDPLGAPDLDGFEEPTIRAVAERIWASDLGPAVRRRALALLAEKVEATR
jgi:DNA repair exonuclease SbcCD nuclease subunit